MQHDKQAAPQAVVSVELDEEMKARMVSLFPEIEFLFTNDRPKEQTEQTEQKGEEQPRNRRPTDRVAVVNTKPVHVAARNVLDAVAEAHGLVFTEKDIEALLLVGATFSPPFAIAVAKAACHRFLEQGWV